MIKEIFQDWLGIKKKENGDALVKTFGESSAVSLDNAVKAYDDNVWVNAAVTLRSEVFANAKFYLWDTKKEERIDEHPVLDLLKKPNPYITRFNLMQLVNMHLDLAGNAYWKYDFEGKNIVAIQPLLPQNVEILTSSKQFIAGYKYTINGKTITFQPEQVTHFISPNPNSLVLGSAPIFSARFAVDTETQSNNWNYNFFKNGGSIGQILKHPNTIAEPERKKIMQQFDEKHKGDKKAFKTIMLTGGLDIDQPGISQKDMEFSQLQLTNRDKIIGVYRVPKLLLAQFEGGSLAEARTAENIFAKYTITPILQSFVETLDLDLLPLFGIDTNELTLKFEPIVETDKEFELQKDDAALNKWMTIDERRKKEGLDPIPEGGDVLYQPLSQVPITFSSEAIGDNNDGDNTNKSVNIKKEYQIKKNRHALKKGMAEFKQEFGRKFLINHTLFELRFIKKLKKAFADQKKEVLAALRKNKNYKYTKSLADDVFDVKKQTQKFINIFTPLIAEIAATNGNEVNMIFGLGVGPVDQLPNFAKEVNAVTLKFAKEINITTQKQIKKQLATGLAEGEGIDELGKRMQGVFKEASTVRSQTIARTETTKASTMGNLMTYKESGVVNGKSWLAVHDGRTREDHAVEIESVLLDEDFLVDGEELAGPGLGSIPGNNINCRCTVLPVIL